MSKKRKVLLQLDSDPVPSVFDRIVAIDTGVDEVLSYGGVTTETVEALIHGAIFTRGPKDLHRTAVFIGGNDISVGEKILQKAVESFLGELRVSVMLDSSGANTTAAAAAVVVSEAVDLRDAVVLILGGAGSVGRRVARLLVQRGARVRVGSRRLERAAEACDVIRHSTKESADLQPAATGSDTLLATALDGVGVVVSAGGPGVCLLPRQLREKAEDLRVVVDLNAVPPLGVEGIEVMDMGVDRQGHFCYGAIGVGGNKMKIHKQAVSVLFDTNDQVLDAERIFEIGCQL